MCRGRFCRGRGRVLAIVHGRGSWARVHAVRSLGHRSVEADECSSYENMLARITDMVMFVLGVYLCAWSWFGVVVVGVFGVMVKEFKQMNACIMRVGWRGSCSWSWWLRTRSWSRERMLAMRLGFGHIRVMVEVRVSVVRVLVVVMVMVRGSGSWSRSVKQMNACISRIGYRVSRSGHGHARVQVRVHGLGLGLGLGQG